jgi:hypothetical protein
VPVLLNGDVLPFFTTVYAEDGETEVPAGSMKLVVTGPTAGTSDTYDPVTPTSGPGSYAIDHPAPVAGRYVGQWIATGNNAGSDLQVFNVDDVVSFAPIVGLDEVKDHLGIDQTSMVSDEELWRMAAAASQRVEAETRLWHRETVTQTLNPRYRLVLTKLPVVSITSITQAGNTTPATSYELGRAGRIRPLPYGSFPWPAELGLITVVYEAGETVVPSAVRDAVLVTVKGIFRSQRGPSRLGRTGGSLEETLAPLPYVLPPGALELLKPYLRGPQVA